MNAVIVMNGATIIFTDEQGNVLDRFAVESITFADYFNLEGGMSNDDL